MVDDAQQTAPSRLDVMPVAPQVTPRRNHQVKRFGPFIITEVRWPATAVDNLPVPPWILLQRPTKLGVPPFVNTFIGVATINLQTPPASRHTLTCAGALMPLDTLHPSHQMFARLDLHSPRFQDIEHT